MVFSRSPRAAPPFCWGQMWASLLSGSGAWASSPWLSLCLTQKFTEAMPQQRVICRVPRVPWSPGVCKEEIVPPESGQDRGKTRVGSCAHNVVEPHYLTGELLPVLLWGLFSSTLRSGIL